MSGWIDGSARNRHGRLVEHVPQWRPAMLEYDAEGHKRPGFVCVHQLENGNGQCGGNVSTVDQGVGNHSCWVPGAGLGRLADGWGMLRLRLWGYLPEWGENWRAWPHCNGQAGCWTHTHHRSCCCRCRWCRIARWFRPGYHYTGPRR